MALFTTFITTPIVMAIYKPARHPGSYKHRTISRPNTDTELRLLACFHGSRNIPTLINLIESSRGTNRRYGLTVYAMHLMELSERSSAISMVHKARRNGLPFFNKKPSPDTDQIIVPFQAYGQLNHVTVRPMTAISHLSSIHEDIIASARLKRAALIILPFHKQQHLDGTMESIGRDYQNINSRMLRCAPCSVGILIDRGLGGTTQVSASEVSYAVAVLFFGGADDREALAYGARIAEHPGIGLVVYRFVMGPGSVGIRMNGADDEEFLKKFRNSTAKNESVKYEKIVVGSKAEIVAAIKGMGRCNLILVGQGAPTMTLTDQKNDCPELGPVGGFLGTSFATMASVMVVKQYDPTANPAELMEDRPVTEEGGCDTPGPRKRGGDQDPSRFNI